MTLAVDIRGVWHSFAGSHGPPALEDVSLSVREGERLGILGPNGGGKSTLLRLVLGLLPLQRGEITVCGVSPSRARRDGLIGYVPQRPEMELAMPLSAREVLALGATWRLPAWRRVPPDMAAQVERTIDLVGAREFAERPVGSLSGGQLQRVLIGRALVSKPRILVLDEPMVGIDVAGQRQFASLLGEIHRTTGVTMLTVTHDLRAIVAGSDQVACLARRLHSHGSPQGLTPAVLAELFSHDVAGLMGELAGMHVHAHGAGETCPDGHRHGPGCSHAPDRSSGPDRSRGAGEGGGA
ncbi:MAG: metal ABC transporter ATP-binding protein [Phycisphaerales bacterium]|jgi:zinc transport system ATP-binding protein